MLQLQIIHLTTIEPNKGYGYVRVEDIGTEFNVKSNPRYGFIKGKYRFVPIEILDKQD